MTSLASLQSWANNGWLRTHQTSVQGIKDMLAIVDRDLADAHGDISADSGLGRDLHPGVFHASSPDVIGL